MNASPGLSSFNSISAAQVAGGANHAAPDTQQLTEREAFDQFVGGTFYRQLLGAMQKTVGKPAYFPRRPGGGNLSLAIERDARRQNGRKPPPISSQDRCMSCFKLSRQ